MADLEKADAPVPRFWNATQQRKEHATFTRSASDLSDQNVASSPDRRVPSKPSILTSRHSHLGGAQGGSRIGSVTVAMLHAARLRSKVNGEIVRYDVLVC